MKLKIVTTKPLEAKSLDSFLPFAKIQFARRIFKINILFQAFVSTTGYRIRSEPLVKRGLSDPDDPR